MSLKFSCTDFDELDNMGDMEIATMGVASRAAEVAQKKFDEWIKEQPLVYSQKDRMSVFWYVRKEHTLFSHTARLVNIEEIKNE